MFSDAFKLDLSRRDLMALREVAQLGDSCLLPLGDLRTWPTRPGWPKTLPQSLLYTYIHPHLHHQHQRYCCHFIGKNCMSWSSIRARCKVKMQVEGYQAALVCKTPQEPALIVNKPLDGDWFRPGLCLISPLSPITFCQGCSNKRKWAIQGSPDATNH